MSLALFEDTNSQTFSAITLTKPSFDVKIGATTHFERCKKKPDFLITREFLQDVTKEKHPNCKVNPSSTEIDTLFVNGFSNLEILDIEKMMRLNHSFIMVAKERVLAAKLPKKDSEVFIGSIVSGRQLRIKRFNVDKSYHMRADERDKLLVNPWDIIKGLESQLRREVAGVHRKSNVRVKVRGKVSPIIDPTAEIEEGVVFDTTNGGIHIGPYARISPSRIVGPAFIGARTQIKQFSTIESSAIGADCRIAGEIEHSIICDYTNKAHAGFVGHSYIGEWVNVGAMTTTSDLKLTYGEIKMKIGGRKTNTHMTKLGSFIGDMVKTSIGTLIYGGLMVGISSHIQGLISEDVPSFTICSSLGSERHVELELDSAIRTQERMMSRRNKNMTRAHKKLIEYLFTATMFDRKQRGVRRMELSIH